MKSEQFRQIVERSARAYKEAMYESEDSILNIIHAASEEAQDNEAEKIVVSIGHTLKLDLTANKQTDKISYSLRHNVEKACTLSDPNQPELFSDEPEDDEAPE